MLRIRALEAAGLRVRTFVLAAKIEDTRGCVNFLVRRSARLIGRHYDLALKPVGLRATQFNVLAVLAQTGEMPLTRLAALLGMERSVLARNLKPLERDGLAGVGTGQDKRVRIAKITKLGRERLQKALPYWAKAQARLGNTLGKSDSARLASLLGKIAGGLEEERS